MILMESLWLLLLIGFLIGTVGTLIGAGGGFILVPLLILFHPGLSAEGITAISMAVVASNSMSGSIAYMINRRVDYKAGIIFAIATIPGSVFGVMTTKAIPRGAFDIGFGVVLIMLAVFLFVKGGKSKPVYRPAALHKGWVHNRLTDKSGEVFEYSYDVRKGTLLSVVVGYLSPVLGIGGGIIHVPAMIEWLKFPVHIATATSHFILAIMATATVITHYAGGSYDDPFVLNMVIGLVIGVIPGAQLGAVLSRKVHGKAIVRALAVCLAIVALRILIGKIS